MESFTSVVHSRHFVYMFLSMLGLRPAQALSACGEWGLLFVVVLRGAVASFVGEHGLLAPGLQ